MNKILRGWDKHWSDDYLLSLRERHYGAQTPHNLYPIKVGDVVLVKSDTPRSTWPLGKIMDVVQDGNGVVRSVEVLSPGTEKSADGE